MPTIGIDCEIILNGVGYFLKPGSYQMQQPRVRKVTVRADNATAYVDLGPGKRRWHMVVLCLNELRRYDGALISMTGQQLRDTLRSSYTSSTGSTITLIDPIGGNIPVHFDTYEEHILDLHSQIIALATGGTLAASYEVRIELMEA